ncbi:MAG: hypothetical protein U9Q18_02540 [Caldisericota bacterium]|nr:hypothetical protein [Caldisericota bacterium]
MKVIQVTDEQARKEAGIPFAKKTLYKWNSTGMHPELFLKIGNKLCINLDYWDKWVEEAIQKTNERVKRLKELKEGVK